MSQKTTNTSFSLLNQQEIDTLVQFLTEKKNAVDSDVMSQNSIDKLIQLIRVGQERLILGASMAPDTAYVAANKKLHFRDNNNEVCELRCNINEDTGFIELSIYNTAKDSTYTLSTDVFDPTDTNGWGLSIPPSLFGQLANNLSLKFTQSTYDFVCRTFAKHNYGSEDHKISECYLLDNQTLIEVLL